MAEEKLPRVVIVGGGFGGLEAAKKLACQNLRLTVIDRTNYHLFQPLLYQVATAALSPADIAAPVRAILHKCKNVEVVLAEVQSVDVNTRVVHAGGAPRRASGRPARALARGGAGEPALLATLAVYASLATGTGPGTVTGSGVALGGASPRVLLIRSASTAAASRKMLPASSAR